MLASFLFSLHVIWELNNYCINIALFVQFFVLIIYNCFQIVSFRRGYASKYIVGELFFYLCMILLVAFHWCKGYDY